MMLSFYSSGKHLFARFSCSTEWKYFRGSRCHPTVQVLDTSIVIAPHKQMS